jgi:hypothetical protein
MMHTHILAHGSRHYSSPRSAGKPSLDAKLDRVFQMAENMDARCVYMIGAATQRRRPAALAR